jgi:hypothetical protein
MQSLLTEFNLTYYHNHIPELNQISVRLQVHYGNVCEKYVMKVCQGVLVRLHEIQTILLNTTLHSGSFIPCEIVFQTQ